MKIRNYFLGAVLAVSGIAIADDYIVVHLANGETEKIAVDTKQDAISINENSFVVAGKEYPFADVEDVSFVYENSQSTEPSDEPTVVYVTWNGGEAPTVKCSSDEVITTIDGGNVLITNTNVDTEYTYVLDGSSDDGSFTLVSDYKSTIKLNGVSLKSSLEEALNIKCGKRVNLVLADDTENSLEDAAVDNGQKGALYCKGHLEVSGGGVLNLTGNVKHALSTKEYCQLKKTTGKINVLKAVSDGIHAGQYFQMNGGVVTISGVGGDGIQAELSADEAYDESLPDGSMLIKGGELTITTTGQDVSALQSDTNLQVDGGMINVKMTGAVSKAFNTDADIVVNDGTISIDNSGTGLTVNSENETSKGFNADNDVKLVGGNITVSMSGAGGKGVKADHDIVVGNSETAEGPVLSVVTTGASFGTSSSTGGGGGWPGGGGRPGGGGGWPGGESSGGSAAKAMKCEGCYYQYGGEIYVETTGSGAEGIESKTASATSMNFNGGNLFMKVYDDCINSAGEINFNGANVICYSTNNDAIDSNYGRTNSIKQTAGVVISFSQRGGAEMGIDADAVNRVTVTGGTLITGGGSQGGSSSSSLGTGSTHYKVWSSSISYAANKYYSIVCGSNIITWLMPASVTSSYNILASDMFKSSTTHYIYNGTTAPTEAESVYNFHNSKDGSPVPMMWIKSNINSGTQSATFSPN